MDMTYISLFNSFRVFCVFRGQKVIVIVIVMVIVKIKTEPLQ